MKKRKFNSFKKVQWQYWHYTNSKSCSLNTKHGCYMGKVRHRAMYNGEQMAIVKFDGNIRSSKVPFKELRFLED